jgi:hypothetical protein
MRTSNLRATVAIGGAFLFISLLSFGCGNPEAPQITKVRLSYWDSIIPVPEDPEWFPDWMSLEDGEVAPQSPVRIQGNVTDNTAVVNPRITWIGDRVDVDESGFTECSEGTKEFYECEMSCEETRAGFFECNPLLPARKLIRGDLFLLTLVTSEGEEYELEIQVSEAQDLLVPESESDPIQIQEDYRILRVLSLTKGPNPFLWSLLQRKVVGGPWLPLRSGDFLALGSGDEAFQIAVEVPEGVALDVPPSAAWRSLVKWNDKSYLNWDATTGDFVEKFQIFDPRDRQEMIDGVGASTYRYVVSAEDVPDQKTKVFRSSQVARELVFLPETATREPDLEVDGEDKELVKTSKSAENISGKVKSFSGEVRSLAFRLSDGPEGSRNRLLYFNPTDISLEGKFTTTMVYVSDWNGDGVVDESNEEENGIPNTLDAVALDVQGNWTYTTVPIVFLPSTKKDQAPELQIQEIFPALDKDQEAALPFGEEVRVRARAADDRGQPAFSAYECTCVAEEPLINDERCPCEALTGGTKTPEREDDWVDLNAGGEFPQDPWEWIVIGPSSETQESFRVLLAKEKVEDPKDRLTAKFSGIEIDLKPETEEDVYNISVSLRVTSGPNVLLIGLKNGDIVDPHGLIVQATIYANVSALNEIVALWNGEPRGAPTYDSETAAFLWDLQAFTVREGDRICVGATSVTGHVTLYLLEFADTTDGLLLGVTGTSNTGECS